MRLWLHVLDMTNVRRVWPVPGIHGAGKNEGLLGMPPRRLEKQFGDSGLAVRRISGHVTEIASKLRVGGNPEVIVWIHASVKRTGHPRSEFLLQLAQDLATGKRQHQVEARDLVAAQVVDAAGFLFDAAQGYGCIQVVEDAQRPVESQDFVVDTPALGKIAGGDSNIRRGGFCYGQRANRLPIRIQSKPAVVAPGEVAA